MARPVLRAVGIRSQQRIHDEMQNVPLNDEVWPKFLRDNAVRVFKLDG
jgi:hypothetical protein